MKNIAFRGIAIFFVLIVATSLMMDVLKLDFGTVNFWDKRGVFFLIFVTIFPRLTLLFSSVAFGGFLWWLGFFFCPRILVASLATVAYFHTNPILVVISWMVAIGGEVFEKWGIGRSRFKVQTFHHGPRATYPGAEPEPAGEFFPDAGSRPIKSSDPDGDPGRRRGKGKKRKRDGGCRDDRERKSSTSLDQPPGLAARNFHTNR